MTSYDVIEATVNIQWQHNFQMEDELAFLLGLWQGSVVPLQKYTSLSFNCVLSPRYDTFIHQ